MYLDTWLLVGSPGAFVGEGVEPFWGKYIAKVGCGGLNENGPPRLKELLEV